MRLELAPPQLSVAAINLAQLLIALDEWLEAPSAARPALCALFGLRR
jgi:hypothetical protein